MKKLTVSALSVALIALGGQSLLSVQRVRAQAGACAAAGANGLRSIPAIQGAGAASPCVGSTVTTEGVVVGDFQGPQGLRGFYLQDPTGDADPATSDGVFVFQGNDRPGTGSATDVMVGDRVRVVGKVEEFGNQTQITSINGVTFVAAGAPVRPTPVEFPVDAVELESLEGMLVRVPEGTITETFALGRFGELVVATTRQFHPNNGGATAALNLGARLLLDDGSTVQNPRITPYLGAAGTRRVGDRVSGLVGILGYGFDQYRLQPTTRPSFAAANPRPAPARPDGGLRVASFNVNNYFTTLGSRGAGTPEEFRRQQAKIVAALRAMDADVVGLVEIENNGATAGEALVAALNSSYGASVYAAVRAPAGGYGGDAIKVDIIYKPARVQPVGAPISRPDPVFERFPVAQTFRPASSGGTAFTVVVSHLKSKNCGSGAAADPDAGQGCWNLKRTEQARALAGLVKDLQASSGDPDVLVMGDLNAYEQEDPVGVLDDVMENLALRVPRAERYSYVFRGEAGYIDHALATPSLAAQVGGVAFWHINADEPPALDYNDWNPEANYRPDPYRSSDHDPVIVSLNLR